MNDKIQTLLNLVKENPDFLIEPMVDYEVVYGDSFGRWMGSFGCCYVGEYACYKQQFYDEREAFEEAYYDYNEEELCEMFNYNPCIGRYSFEHGENTKEEYEENKKNEELLNEYLHKTADKYFKKAIIVNIDLPEDDDVKDFNNLV